VSVTSSTLAPTRSGNSQLLQEFTLHLYAERGLRENTVLAYISDLTQFAEVLSERDVILFTADTADVALFLQHLTKHDIGKRSRARKIATLRTFYKWLIAHERLDKDPMRLTKNPKLEKLLPYPVELRAMEQIINTAGDRAAAEQASIYELRDYAIFEVLYGGAVRVSELCDIAQRDIELEGKTARVLGKGSKQRIVPLGETAIIAIENYLRFARPLLLKKGHANTRALFLSDQGRRITRQRVWQIVKATGENMKPHRLRHSAATHMLAGGADLRQVQELLGHAGLGTTQIYTQVTPGALQKAHRDFHPRG